MMINKTRILNEFIELVSVPCPSKDEKAEADLLVQKLQAMGLEVKVDDAGRKIVPCSRSSLTHDVNAKAKSAAYT